MTHESTFCVIPLCFLPALVFSENNIFIFESILTTPLKTYNIMSINSFKLKRNIILISVAVIAFSALCTAASMNSTRGEAIVQIGNSHTYLYINRDECIGCGIYCDYAGFYIADDGKVWVDAANLNLIETSRAVAECPLAIMDIFLVDA